GAEAVAANHRAVGEHEPPGQRCLIPGLGSMRDHGNLSQAGHPGELALLDRARGLFDWAYSTGPTRWVPLDWVPLDWCLLDWVPLWAPAIGLFDQPATGSCDWPSAPQCSMRVVGDAHLGVNRACGRMRGGIHEPIEEVPMRERLMAETKAALKAQDKPRLSAL